MSWRLGTRELGDWPTVILAVDDSVSREALQEALAMGAHAIEFRIDRFSNQEPDAVAETVQRLAVGPSLATIRHASEGGGWDRSEEERLALYRHILPLVDGVDVELAHSDLARTLFEEARTVQRLSIGSYHDFSACPAPEKLDYLVQAADELKADILKVAGHCTSSHDLRMLSRFLLDFRQRGLVVIGMGEAGVCSRVFFPALGSLLTYSFLGTPSAPGQLNSTSLIEYLSQFRLDAHPAS